MIQNLVIGCLLIVICLVIQCFAIAFSLRGLIVLEKKQIELPLITYVILVLSAGLTLFLIGYLIQITIWAWVYYLFNEFVSFDTAFYHSAVNFTTLGYGDIVMSENRRLLGALEGINGVLMFGLSTGFLYTILNTLLKRAWDKRMA